jgi:cytoskeletal protein CcmA (bactofilin family)
MGLALAILGLVWTAGPAQALDFRRGENVTIEKQETVDGAAYMAGTTLIVDGRVRGDLYCAGQDVIVYGVVEGDVLCAGQHLKIAGEVEGDVRAAGQIVEVLGKVNGSVTLFGQNAYLGQSAVVTQDVNIFASNATLEGKIGRDVLASAQTLTYKAATARNAELTAESINLQASSSIGGNLNFTSKADSLANQDQVVAGTATHYPYNIDKKQEQPKTVGKYLAGPLYWFAAFALIGVLLLLALPRFMQRIEQVSVRQPWLTLGCGFLALLVVPLLSVAAMLSLIGIPLGIIMFASFVVALLLSEVVAAYAFGRFLADKLGWKTRGQRYIALALGLFILLLLALVPILGGLVMLVGVLWGLGLLGMSFKNSKGSAKPAKASH